MSPACNDSSAGAPYYRRDLALVHDRGFAFHAEQCAPGVIEFLQPVLERQGLVLEFGCGSGLLTERLVDAGHRVIATDASPPMLELARERVGGRAQEIRQLTLPDDPLPTVDAIVGVGHPLNYLGDAASIERAMTAMAKALRPGGLLAFDICDLEWGNRDLANIGRAGPDWAIITEFSTPSPDRFIREMTTFVPAGDGHWRRDHERHENVLVDTARIPSLMSAHGVEVSVREAFGSENLPTGLHAVLGRRNP